MNSIRKLLLWFWDRITKWAELAGRIWASYWLLIIGACLILGSVVLRWLMFPFSRHVKGLQLPLLSSPGVIPHIHLLSYGVIAVGFLAVGFFLRNRVRFGLA